VSFSLSLPTIMNLRTMIWLPVMLLLTGCQLPLLAMEGPLPTLAAVAEAPTVTPLAAVQSGIPPTWTPPPATTEPTATPTAPVLTLPPTNTPLPIPTNTPITPTPTPSITPTPTLTPTATPRPIDQYSLHEPLPLELYPRPPNDNGWGMHWIPTVSQDRATVDRFVTELVRMHIKWVVFLNDGTNIGKNDYLVDRLVANGIMPVMRLYRSGILPYDGDLGPMVRHYRARGVYYYQLYNEPNINDENHQGFANPNQYAIAWAASAREVINNGGYPGIGALSPGGQYDHYAFLDRTIQALRWNGDMGLLNRSWLSVHNYHGLRPFDDPHGFLLFRNYDEIIRHHLQFSMPMIGTEAGSYSQDPLVEKQHLIRQYSYMRDAEPYFFAHSHWLLANLEGGSADPTWEWQTLFRSGFVHPVVTEFFYRNRR
jgi:hypothetical protein